MASALTRKTATSRTKLILVRSFSLHIRLSIILIATTSSLLGSYSSSSSASSWPARSDREVDTWGTNNVGLDFDRRVDRIISLALQTRLKAPSPITRSTFQYLECDVSCRAERASVEFDVAVKVDPIVNPAADDEPA
jgi:hypothetical protein